MTCDLFLFAGEKSGDLYGGKLLRALKSKNPEMQIQGVGGPAMRVEGMHPLLPMEAFEVMGFVDVLWALPKLLAHMGRLTETILSLEPKVVLTIDYPEFSLRLARRLKKRGFCGKICHFICPTVWAWGKKRIPLMEKSLDLLLTILPFEKAYLAHTKLNVAYVGHPLAHDIASISRDPRDFVALFPGSRKKVIERQLPLYLRICHTLHLPVAISLAHDGLAPLIHSIVAKAPPEIRARCTYAPPQDAYALMRTARFALAASGTVTLELALHHCPTIVTYAISPIDLFIARDLLRIRLPFYALPNLIAQREIFPELIGPNLSEQALLAECQKCMSTEYRQEMVQRCASLRPLLDQGDAIERAAEQVLKDLACDRLCCINQRINHRAP